MNPEEFVLIQDSDCHWYVCPADLQDKAAEFFAQSEVYWEQGNYDAEPPADPAWLIRVGGAPSLVRFTGWRIEE